MQVLNEPPNEAPSPPPLQMCTARPGELRIGPTLFEVLKRIELGEHEVTAEQLDAALRREGFIRRYDWISDGAGAWTLVAQA